MMVATGSTKTLVPTYHTYCITFQKNIMLMASSFHVSGHQAQLAEGQEYLQELESRDSGQNDI
jgi:hypothetical protein